MKHNEKTISVVNGTGCFSVGNVTVKYKENEWSPELNRKSNRLTTLVGFGVALLLFISLILIGIGLGGSKLYILMNNIFTAVMSVLIIITAGIWVSVFVYHRTMGKLIPCFNAISWFYELQDCHTDIYKDYVLVRWRGNGGMPYYYRKLDSLLSDGYNGKEIKITYKWLNSVKDEAIWNIKNATLDFTDDKEVVVEIVMDTSSAKK